MDSWERFDEAFLPKRYFYSSLNMENITIVEYRCAKRVFKNFNNKDIGDYHDLYVIYYYLQMYLRILEINALKYMSLIRIIFCLHLD